MMSSSAYNALILYVVRDTSRDIILCGRGRGAITNQANGV